MALAAPAILVADSAFASLASSAAMASRALSFHHTHTDETLTAEYFTGGSYMPDALTAINHHLRDFRTGEEHVIDPALLDLLHRLRRPRNRDTLRGDLGLPIAEDEPDAPRQKRGVAASSLHMEGKAIDIRLVDVPLSALRVAALGLRAGGVGFYPESDFVHVDTGRVSTW